MAELPDIVVAIDALRPCIEGQLRECAQIASSFLLRPFEPPLDEAHAKRVLGLRRLGQRIVWAVETDLFLVLHRMIAGRFKWQPRGAKVPGTWLDSRHVPRRLGQHGGLYDRDPGGLHPWCGRLHPQTGGEGLPKNVQVLLEVLSEIYAPVLGKSLAMGFIEIGAFAVLYSTMFSSPASSGRALTDFLVVNRFIVLKSPEERRWWIRRFCAGLCFLALFLFVTIGDPMLRVSIGGTGEVTTLPLLATAVITLRFRRTDRRITPGRWWDLFLFLSFLALCLTAGYGLGSNLRALLVRRPRRFRLKRYLNASYSLPSTAAAILSLRISSVPS